MQGRILPSLYYAHSRVSRGEGSPGVEITRFRYDKRPKPVAPYEDMVVRYGRLTESAKRIIEEYLDELLTEEEIEALRSYLWAKHRWELTLQGEPLPARFESDPEMGRGTSSFRAAVARGLQYPYRVLNLSEEESYGLPFQIWGWYSLYTTPQVES